MAPRQATIARMVEQANTQIRDDRCPYALKTLEALDNRLNARKSATKKPNAYAEFVKKQFPIIKKQNPDLGATEIMPIIADLWRKRNGSGTIKA